MVRSVYCSMLYRPLVFLAILFAVLIAACDSGTADPRMTDPPVTERVAACHGVQGTLHTGAIDTETWRADRPHVIRDSLIVQGTLVIEAGVKVCGDSAAAILITTNGRLNALGSAAAPIIFTATDPAKPWAGIDVQYDCSDLGCVLPPLRGQIRHALFEYAQNAVTGLQVDSSHFRQIRCTAVRTRYLAYSVVDTAGISGCSAVVMGSRSGGTDTFLGNIIRGSGGDGLAFVAQALHTSGRLTASLILRDSRIENSAGTGLLFNSWYVDANVLEGGPIRIVGSGSRAVEAPLAAVLQLWPTRAAQDSLLGNGNDTLLVWGDASSGEIVVRENMHWRFRSDILRPWWILAGVDVDVEPDGTLIVESELRMQGSLLVQGTAAQPANLVGAIIRQCMSPGPCSTRLSHASLTNVLLFTGPNATLDHLQISGGGISLGSMSVLTQSIITGTAGLMLADNTRVEHTIIRGSIANGVSIWGSNVLLADCEVSGSRFDAIRVVSGAPVLTNIQVRNCILENSTDAGINSTGTQPSLVDARFNWWGDAAGPFGPAGDSVSANVDYSSFLTTRPVIRID